jgi:hypothetical protein
MATKSESGWQMVPDPDYKDGKPTKADPPLPLPPPTKRKPAPPKKYANGGVTRAMAAPAKAKGKKELPPFMKKDAKAKPKKMMGGGSCK